MTNFNKLTNIRSLNSTNFKVGDKVKDKGNYVGYIIAIHQELAWIQYEDYTNVVCLELLEKIEKSNYKLVTEDKPNKNKKDVFDIAYAQAKKEVLGEDKPQKNSEDLVIEFTVSNDVGKKLSMVFQELIEIIKDLENENKRLKKIEVELPEEEPETLSKKIWYAFYYPKEKQLQIMGNPDKENIEKFTNRGFIPTDDAKEFISKILEIVNDEDLLITVKNRMDIKIKKLVGEKLL